MCFCLVMVVRLVHTNDAESYVGGSTASGRVSMHGQQVAAGKVHLGAVS
jgi:hypothetical protein